MVSPYNFFVHLLPTILVKHILCIRVQNQCIINTNEITFRPPRFVFELLMHNEWLLTKHLLSTENVQNTNITYKGETSRSEFYCLNMTVIKLHFS